MISLVIPLYNKESSIGRSIQSILGQSYNDIELVVVNDGSTDNSEKAVLELLGTLEPSKKEKVRLINQPNGGPSCARNTGIAAATGEWIVTLDADDELVDNALEFMMEEVKRFPKADIIDFGGYKKDERGLTKRYHPLCGKVSNPLRALYFRQISPSCGHAIIKASLLKQFPYDERIRRFEDYELELRMLQKATVYSSQKYTEIHDCFYAAASNARKDIKEDFMGYLNMNGGGFWYKMCLFRTFLEERENYGEVCRKMYPSLYKRYDLLLMHKILLLIDRKLHKN